MSDPAAKTVTRVLPGAAAKASPDQVFLEFLVIGITSFRGVVPYLRASLVTKRHWIDDKEFVGMLSINQSLPGLNA
jgi:chromate transporter